MVNRVADKERAKQILKQNGNQSGMVGMEILNAVVSNITTNLLRTVISSGVLVVYTLLLYWTIWPMIKGIFEFDSLFWGYDPVEHINWFAFVLLCILKIVLTPVLSVIDYAISAPFDVARCRYYLYLRKNGVRTKATTVFEGFDFFMQFAITAGACAIHIFWLPMIVMAVNILLLCVFLISALVTNSLVLAVFALVIYFIGATIELIVSIYRSYQLWPMYWIMADHPQMSASQVINRCIQMTRGHIWDLFVLNLSFIGWEILSSFTLELLRILYLVPYANTTYALVYEELKGRPIVLDGIQGATRGSGLNAGVAVKDLIALKEVHPMPKPIIDPEDPGPGPVPPYAAPALLGISGMYAGSNFPLTPDQPVILGRDSAAAQIVFSQGAQKISRRHCEVMFNSQTQQYRVTDFSSNGTYVNGSRLPANAPVKLARGTEIALGDSNNIMKLL